MARSSGIARAVAVLLAVVMTWTAPGLQAVAAAATIVRGFPPISGAASASFAAGGVSLSPAQVSVSLAPLSPIALPAASLPAAPAPGAEGVSKEAAVPPAQAPAPLAGAAAGVPGASGEETAAARIPDALERTKQALGSGAEDQGAPQPLVKFVRPVVTTPAFSTPASLILEPASKKVGLLRDMLRQDKTAAVADAVRRLGDPDDDRAEIKAHAARLLIEHADAALPLLATALASEKNWHVRRELAYGLGLRAGEPGREQAVEALRSALADEDASVHLMAHWALQQFGVDPGPARPLQVIAVEEKAAPPLTFWQKVGAVLKNPFDRPAPRPGEVQLTRGQKVKRALKRTLIALAVVGALGAGIAGQVHLNQLHPELAMSVDGYTPSMGFEGAVPLDQPQTAAVPAPAAPLAPVQIEPPAPKSPTARIADTLDKMLFMQVKAAADAQASFWMNLGIGAVFLGGFGFLSWYMSRRKTGDKKDDKGSKPKGSNDPSRLLKADVKTATDTGTRFNDLAGIETAMNAMNEIVDFLKHPEEYKARKAKMPRGVLLVGPPGTGKTAIARALANEAGIPFFTMSGSDFVEMFVGVGASRVRDLFAQAREAAKASGGRAIIFIDEIDAIGKKRGGHNGNDEREQTLNQLLTELNGFDNGEDGIFLIGATNRADTLDEALLRPGRFDRHIQVMPADVIGREAILEKHMRGVPLAADVDLAQIAQRSAGRSGAFLKNFVNEASLNAARNRRSAVTAKDFDVALTRSIIGDEAPVLLDEKDKERVSYHEAGHVFTGRKLNKVTIIAHGNALGYAEPAEEIEKRIKTKKDLVDELVILMGGRVAEEIQYGAVAGEESSTGASNDFERATQIARSMVTLWGMSKSVGYAQTVPDPHNPYVSAVSEETKALVDREVRAIVQEAHDAAEKKLRADWPKLDAMARELIQHETLYRHDIDRLTGR